MSTQEIKRVITHYSVGCHKPRRLEQFASEFSRFSSDVQGRFLEVAHSMGFLEREVRAAVGIRHYNAAGADRIVNALKQIFDPLAVEKCMNSFGWPFSPAKSRALDITLQERQPQPIGFGA